jgi:hypothetical protein
MSDGILGVTTTTGEITIIQGWNWYAGADVGAIGSGQYDFETVITHELGHSLGLGHSALSTSVMFPTLAPGSANRSLTVADLNVPDADGGGASGLHAAGFRPVSPSVVNPIGQRSGSTAAIGRASIPALDSTVAAHDAFLIGRSPTRADVTKRVTVQGDALRGSRASGMTFPSSVSSRRLALDPGLVDALLSDTTTERSLIDLDLNGNGHPAAKRKPAWRS